MKYLKIIIILVMVLVSVNLVSGAPFDGLNHYWGFNGDDVFADSIGSAGLTNVSTGAPLNKTGILGNAINFDFTFAVSSKVPIITLDLMENNSFTFNFWANEINNFSNEVDSNPNPIYAIRQLPNTGHYFGFSDLRHFEFLRNSVAAGEVGVNSSAVYACEIDGGWCMYTIRHIENSGVLELWRNGTFFENVSIVLNGENQSQIMRLGQDDSIAINRANLTLDEVAIWNRSLTNSDISDLYGGGSPPDFDPIVEESQTFNSSVFETANENFIVNVTYNSTRWTSITANLIYNGTSFLGSGTGLGDSQEFSRALDIPTSNQSKLNVSFHWEVLLSNATDTSFFNSTTEEQEINQLVFIQCNATYPDPVFVNFSIFDEGNLSAINASFKSTFQFSLGGAIQKNLTFDAVTNLAKYEFCTNTNQTFFVDSIININANGYRGKTYTFSNESYTNVTTEKSLFLLNESEGSNIIIQVVNPGLQPLEGYFVDIDRFYPENNSFTTVISDETDEFGQFVARLIENTVKYRFSFKNPFGITVKTTGKVTIACRTSICVMQFVIEDTTDDFDRFENVTDFESTLSFDNNTNIFSVSWNDVTGDIITFRLFVQRIEINGTSTICNTTSTSISSTMNCSVGGDRFSYRSQFFRQVAGSKERRISVLNIKVGDVSVSIFGREGLFWVFLILFTLVGVGSFNPTVGAALYLVGFIGFGLMGVISFNIPILFANIVLVILFIWAFRS